MGEIASREQLRWAFLRWAFVTVPLIVLLGFASSRLAPSGDANPWYRVLVKPAGTPPDWVFPLAWSILYILMGFALAMVLNARGARGRGIAIALFLAQLLLNLVWAPVFFGAHRVSLALGLIGGMVVLGIATTLVFGRIRTAAAWLMVPYLVWISYAGALTWGIDRLNPAAESLVPAASVTQIPD